MKKSENENTSQGSQGQLFWGSQGGRVIVLNLLLDSGGTIFRDIVTPVSRWGIHSTSSMPAASKTAW